MSDFKHKTAGPSYSKSEFENEDRHDLNGGAQGDFIYWDAASGTFKGIAHQANLSAHTLNIWSIPRTGQYFSAPEIGGTGNLTMVQYSLYYCLIIVARTMTFDRIAVDIETADVGQDIRLGIYNVDAALEPTTLILDAGLIDTDGIGLKAAVINQQLTKGIYALVAITDSNSTAAIVNAVCYSSPFGKKTNFDQGFQGWNRTGVAGDFASLAANAAVVTNLDSSPAMIGLRIASLD